PGGPPADLSPPPAAGRLHRDPVGGLEPARRLRRQLLAVQEVATRAPGLAALEALRPVAPAVGEQRQRRGLERPQGADEAVAAAVPPTAPGAVDQLVALHAQRQLE